MKYIDKNAILALHISRILRERTFGRKKANFERVLQMVINQLFKQILAKNSVRWFSKVNAAEKFGVDFLFFGVLTETRKGAKNARKIRTKAWDMCKN